MKIVVAGGNFLVIVLTALVFPICLSIGGRLPLRIPRTHTYGCERQPNIVENVTIDGGYLEIHSLKWMRDIALAYRIHQ